MLRVGLTGSMATGKTTVLETFAQEGIPIYSADAAVHELYAGKAAALVESLFPGVVSAGVVDRSKLSAAIAAEPDRLSELESVIHPLVRQKALDFFEASEADGAVAAVIEIPLLYETGTKYPLDKVVVTWCRPEIQRERILGRPNMSVAKMDLVLSRQMPQDEKAALADHVIDTSGTLEQTRDAARALAKLWHAGSP